MQGPPIIIIDALQLIKLLLSKVPEVYRHPVDSWSVAYQQVDYHTTAFWSSHPHSWELVSHVTYPFLLLPYSH